MLDSKPLFLSKYWLVSSWPWWLSAGLITVQFLPHLWLIGNLAASSLLGMLWYFSPRIKGFIGVLFLIFLGASWGSYWGLKAFNYTLPLSLIKQDIWIHGSVMDLPQQRSHALKFKFHIDSISHLDKAYPFSGDTLLNWYDKPYPQLKVGERWRLKVRLKPAHGSLNPGGFNYEQWLFSQGIRVTGYVRSTETASRISPSKGWYFVARLRADIKNFIDSRNLPMGGLLKALAIGDRSSIDEHQWRIFRDTGTAHLVAISGLHIGLVAGLAYFMAWLYWRYTLLASCLFPAQIIAKGSALLAALCYSALAGFALPTLRALMMLIAYFALQSVGRNPGTLFTLGFVLAIVLVFDPLAPLSASLWLSFGAVGAIAHVMGSQKQIHLEHDISPPKKGLIVAVKQRLGQWTQIQWAVFIALMPLSLLFFGQFSIVSIPANFIAIPIIGIVVVPLVLLSIVCFSFGLELIASSLLTVANAALEFIWPLLNKLAFMPYSILQSAAPQLWAIFLAGLSIIVLLASRYGKLRFFSAFGFLPLFMPNTNAIEEGAFELQILDVGQGLALIVQTKQHNLIYDAGIKYASGFDVGKAIIEPFIRQMGISTIDTAVISHKNVDHYGGMAAALEPYPYAKRYSSAGFYAGSEPCEHGMQWQWEQVTFTFVHPKVNNLASGNNDSCVLLIRGSYGSALITGDIERETEQVLLAELSNQLQADVLIVPHHGSKSSSTPAFIKAVDPKIAIISAGHLNRFKHPHQSVIDRYLKHKSKLINTATSGWIRIIMDKTGVRAQRYRKIKRRYWMLSPD